MLGSVCTLHPGPAAYSAQAPDIDVIMCAVLRRAENDGEGATAHYDDHDDGGGGGDVDDDNDDNYDDE